MCVAGVSQGPSCPQERVATTKRDVEAGMEAAKREVAAAQQAASLEVRQEVRAGMAASKEAMETAVESKVQVSRGGGEEERWTRKGVCRADGERGGGTWHMLGIGAGRRSARIARCHGTRAEQEESVCYRRRTGHS